MISTRQIYTKRIRQINNEYANKASAKIYNYRTNCSIIRAYLLDELYELTSRCNILICRTIILTIKEERLVRERYSLREMIAGSYDKYCREKERPSYYYELFFIRDINKEKLFIPYKTLTMTCLKEMYNKRINLSARREGDIASARYGVIPNTCKSNLMKEKSQTEYSGRQMSDERKICISPGDRKQLFILQKTTGIYNTVGEISLFDKDLRLTYRPVGQRSTKTVINRLPDIEKGYIGNKMRSKLSRETEEENIAQWAQPWRCKAA